MRFSRRQFEAPVAITAERSREKPAVSCILVLWDLISATVGRRGYAVQQYNDMKVPHAGGAGVDNLPAWLSQHSGVGRLATACAVAIWLSLSVSGGFPAYAAKSDNSVRFATQETLGNIDPYFNNARTGLILADQIWDTLIYRDPETGAYKGALATDWRWIDDKTLELDLRQGVKFHNGEAFDADDVVHTVNFVAKPESKVLAVNVVRWIDHAEKRAKYKVRIMTKQPFPAAIAYLAAPRLVIHPNEYYGTVGPKGMSERPIGSGPYRLVEHALGKYIRLERNPDYFRDSPKSQPKIDRFELRFIPDAQTRVAEIVAGSLDLIMNVPRDQAEQLRGIPALQILSGETMLYTMLQLNALPGTPAPQLRDVRVRKAIMHAIDREAIVKFLVGEHARVLHAECFPAQFGCTDLDVPHYDYDPQKARQLLADAGFANGFAIDLYAYRDRNQTEALIGYLRDVGIRARLRFLQSAAVVSARRSGKVGLAQYDWGSGGISDVSNSVSVFHDFSSDDMSRDQEIHELLARGDSSMDPNVRKEAYARALKMIAERAYVLPLYSQSNYYVAADGLAFKASADEIPRVWEMYWK
jgi:peptide/nickel transport system substrate-binding protein